ncbi:unnamed protein product [Ceratitis capitata]|uniref:(Mediterranean fruit fly) hypothetical protein n=1 Tax=Ceratitis capitata TaxID=7213 RepID=A0A811UPY4_CERCA|nr:unnamed protein product [Ceratitis capitata]
MTEQAQPLSITINPLKYLNQLPEFNGDYRDLQTFVNLIDRVHPLLTAYDLPSQLLFSDIIKETQKSQQQNRFVNWFWPSSQRMCQEQYETALNIFKEKVPEPMRAILICRNPDSLETAMEILFQSGYAYVTSPNTTFCNHRTPNQEYKNLRTQKHNNRSYNNQNLARTNNRDTQKNLSYQQPNFHNHHRNNPNNPHNWQGNHKNSGHNGQPFQRQNNWNPFRQQNSGHNGQPFQRQNNWNPFRQQEIPHTNNFPYGR